MGFVSVDSVDEATTLWHFYRFNHNHRVGFSCSSLQLTKSVGSGHEDDERLPKHILTFGLLWFSCGRNRAERPARAAPMYARAVHCGEFAVVEDARAVGNDVPV